MASNPLVDIFRIKDLRDRILFTVAMLLVFRLGAVLPIPGVNVTATERLLYRPAEFRHGRHN